MEIQVDDDAVRTYRRWLIEHCSEPGVSTELVESFEPVLHRMSRKWGGGLDESAIEDMKQEARIVLVTLPPRLKGRRVGDVTGLVLRAAEWAMRRIRFDQHPVRRLGDLRGSNNPSLLRFIAKIERLSPHTAAVLSQLHRPVLSLSEQISEENDTFEDMIEAPPFSPEDLFIVGELINRISASLTQREQTAIQMVIFGEAERDIKTQTGIYSRALRKLISKVAKLSGHKEQPRLALRSLRILHSSAPGGVHTKWRSASLEDAFFNRIKRERGHWLWTGTFGKQGGGVLHMQRGGVRRNAMARRVSYEMHRGPLPDRVRVFVSCDAPKCVNPDHLATTSDGVMPTGGWKMRLANEPKHVRRSS